MHMITLRELADGKWAVTKEDDLGNRTYLVLTDKLEEAFEIYQKEILK